MNEYDYLNSLLVGFFIFLCMPTLVGVGILIVNLRKYLRCKTLESAKKGAVFGLILSAVTFPMFCMGARCLIDFFRPMLSA